MRLVFEDDFDGATVNASKWLVLDGVVNRGGMYLAANVVVRDGALVLRTVPRNYTHNHMAYYVASGAVRSRFTQRTGRWEARVKLPRPNESPSYTLHSSIWLNSAAFGTKTPGQSGCQQASHNYNLSLLINSRSHVVALGSQYLAGHPSITKLFTCYSPCYGSGKSKSPDCV